MQNKKPDTDAKIRIPTNGAESAITELTNQITNMADLFKGINDQVESLNNNVTTMNTQ
jgi:hypothetical protein